MKNHLQFNLKGKKLFPFWLVMYLLVIFPYTYLLIYKSAEMGTSMIENSSFPATFFIFFIFMLVVLFVLTFYFTKLAIQGIEYKEKALLFGGDFWKYFGMVLLGFFLSIITIGIYIPWYSKNIQRFFINNTEFEGEKSSFLGKGNKLLVIMLLSFFLPFVLFMLITVSTILSTTPLPEASLTTSLFQFILYFALIPFYYLCYKWLVNISYKNYLIVWDTIFWPSCGKIFIEMFLSIITLGIYFPLAMIRIYAYFAEKTIITGGDITKKFGYEKNQLQDFLFLWGQILLTIITLGFYFPWAYCKIGKRILGKTYIEQVMLPR